MCSTVDSFQSSTPVRRNALIKKVTSFQELGKFASHIDYFDWDISKWDNLILGGPDQSEFTGVDLIIAVTNAATWLNILASRFPIQY